MECPICLTPIAVCKTLDKSGVRLPCGHAYHFKCIRKWTQQSDACPYCRCPLHVAVDSDDFIDEDSDDDNYVPPCETVYRGPLSPIVNKTRPRRLRMKLRKQTSRTISFR